MSRQRSARLVTLIAVLSIARYALLLDSAARLHVDNGRVLLLAGLTVLLWVLNGAGLVALFRFLKQVLRGF